MVNATVTNLDNNAAGVAQRFQPSIRPTSLRGSNKEGYVQFAITFKKTSDNSVVKLEGLTYRHFDVDGSSTPSYTFRETGWVTGHSSLLVNSPSGLESGGATVAGGYTKVLGELREHNGITSDPGVYFFWPKIGLVVGALIPPERAELQSLREAVVQLRGTAR
jgi:hypothetical protein